MNKVEMLLMDYVNLLNSNINIPSKGVSAKFKWLKMANDYTKSDRFTDNEKNKVDDLSTNIIYLNI